MLRRRVGGPSGPVVSALCLGALPFGTTVDEKTSFAILDRFTEAGGDLVDTADNYAFWVPGGSGDESESTVGRWLASRRMHDKVVISTKAGARPTVPGSGLETAEGLSAPVLRKAAEDSLRRLGTDRLDLYWTHIEDRSVPLEETLGALEELVGGGKVAVLGFWFVAGTVTARARNLVAEPLRASRYPSATSCAYASVTTHREQPRSAARDLLGGRALPEAIRPPVTAARSARVSRTCSGPSAGRPSSRKVPQAGSVRSSATTVDATDRPAPVGRRARRSAGAEQCLHRVGPGLRNCADERQTRRSARRPGFPRVGGAGGALVRSDGR